MAGKTAVELCGSEKLIGFNELQQGIESDPQTWSLWIGESVGLEVCACAIIGVASRYVM